MSRVHVFIHTKEHFWKSMNIIEENILCALKSSNIDFELVDSSRFSSYPNKKDIKYAYFLSDGFLWQENLELLENFKGIKYIFPVYGNMTMELNRWNYIDKKLKGFDVHLLAASTRSKKQLQALTKNALIHVVPYPTEAQEIIKDKSSHMVYAGRITPQKNILELMNTFLKAVEYNFDLRLNICGNFDKRAYHLHGYSIDFKCFKSWLDVRINHIVFNQKEKDYENI